MKKMRKFMALSLAVLMVVAALSGCGSKKEFPSDTITIYVHAAAGGGDVRTAPVQGADQKIHALQHRGRGADRIFRAGI